MAVMKTILIIGLIVWFLLMIGYIAAVAWDAKHDTKAAPREDMFTCDKHGVFAKRYVTRLTGVTEEPIDYCPFCLEDRFREAKKSASKGSN